MRVLALIEDSGLEVSDSSTDAPAVAIRGEKTHRFKLHQEGAVLDNPNVSVRVLIGQIDTSSFDTGSYDCELHMGETVVGLGESLWILEEDDFRRLLEEEVSQSSPEAGSFFGTEHGAASSRQSLERLVQEALSQRLCGFLTAKGRLLMDPTFAITFEGGAGNFSSDLLLYAAEVFADQCRDSLLFGVAESALSVVFSESFYRFFLRVEFTDALNAEDRRRLSVAPKKELTIIESILKKLTQAQIAGAVEMPDGAEFLTVLLEVRAVTSLAVGQ